MFKKLVLQYFTMVLGGYFMSTNYLKNFAEGETIKASETNSNNQFLLSKISEGTSNIQATVSSQISNIKSDLETTRNNLETKLDTKLSDDDKAKITNWGLPDYEQGTDAKVSKFTAPADGVLYANHNKNESFGSTVKINGVDVVGYWDYQGEGGLLTVPYTLLLSKGDVVEFPGTIYFAKFFPFKGGV